MKHLYIHDANNSIGCLCTHAPCEFSFTYKYCYFAIEVPSDAFECNYMFVDTCLMNFPSLLNIVICYGSTLGYF